MKKILLIAAVLAISAPAFAGHHGHQGPQGPQGPVGPVGPRGPRGFAGLNGVDGEDASTDPKVLLSSDVRIWDLKHASLYFFDNYNWFDRHNDSFGVRVSFKLGDSYESRQLEALENRMRLLVELMSEARQGAK